MLYLVMENVLTFELYERINVLISVAFGKGKLRIWLVLIMYLNSVLVNLSVNIVCDSFYSITDNYRTLDRL